MELEYDPKMRNFLLQSQLVIQLELCNEGNRQQFDCLTDAEQINQFFQVIPYFQLTMTFSNFDYQTNRMELMTMIFPIQVHMTKWVDFSDVFSIQTQHTMVDSGIPFDINNKQFQHVVSTDYLQQYLNERELNRIRDSQVLRQIVLKLHNVQLKVSVKHWTLIDILVILFGFFRLLMSLGVVSVKRRARSLLNKQIQYKILKQKIRDMAFRQRSATKHIEESWLEYF